MIPFKSQALGRGGNEAKEGNEEEEKDEEHVEKEEKGSAAAI